MGEDIMCLCLAWPGLVYERYVKEMKVLCFLGLMYFLVAVQDKYMVLLLYTQRQLIGGEDCVVDRVPLSIASLELDQL